MKRNTLLIILLLLFLSFPAVFPLIHHGFFQTDDGEWMIIRLSAFYQALRDGQFPVRFLQRLNFGFGYPVAEFLYPGSFYFASILHVIRFGFVNAIKLVYGFSLLGSVFFTYFWLSKLFSKRASVVGALFALYIPYHLYDVYKRGTMEVFALLWVPFILWQMERKSIFWVGIGIGLLLVSHNTMALLFLPVLYIYSLLRKLYPFWRITIIFILGGLLASFFTIPAVLELHYTVFSQTAVSNPLLYFASLRLIGYTVLIVLIGTAMSFFLKKKEVSQHSSLAGFFFIISILTVFVNLPLSGFFWKLPVASFIQFPFRVLSYFVISIAFLAGYLVSFGAKWQQWTGSVVLILLLFYFALPYVSPKVYFDKGEGYYYTNDATTTVQDEYMPVWVKKKPVHRPRQQVVVTKDAGKVSNIIQTAQSLRFTAQLTKRANIRVNIIYWPGWHMIVDGRPAAFSYSNPSGVMMVSLPKGTHRVQVLFGEDTIRYIADVLSILSCIGLLIFTKRYSRNVYA